MWGSREDLRNYLNTDTYQEEEEWMKSRVFVVSSWWGDAWRMGSCLVCDAHWICKLVIIINVM